MTTRALLIGFGSVALLAAAGGWAAWPDAGVSGITVVAIERGTVSRTVTLRGFVWPTRRATIKPSVVGRIKRIRVERGTDVVRGQVVAEMDSPSVQADLQRRRLGLRRAETRLRQSKTADQTELSQLDLEQARLDLEAAERQARELLLRSPLDGVVISVGFREGDVVGPGALSTSPAISVADLSDYVVDVEGDEQQVISVQQGSLASVVLLSAQERPLRGTVLDTPSIRRAASLGTAGASIYGFVVKLSEPASADLVRAIGASARVEIEVERREDVPIVPLTALFRVHGQDRILVAADAGFRSQAITMGFSDDYVMAVDERLLGLRVATGDPSRLLGLSDVR